MNEASSAGKRRKTRTGLFRTYQQGVIVAGSDSLIVSANAAAHAMFGYEDGALVGRNLSILMFEDEARAHHAGLAEYRAGGSSKIIDRVREVVGRRRDGSEIEIDLSISETVVGQEVPRLVHQ